MVYAVIDTNIFVSALITHNSNASTARVLESLFLHRITPLYNEDIIKEYDEVLHRAKVYHHYSVPTILQVVTRICFRKKLFYYRF